MRTAPGREARLRRVARRRGRRARSGPRGVIDGLRFELAPARKRLRRIFARLFSSMSIMTMSGSGASRTACSRTNKSTRRFSSGAERCSQNISAAASAPRNRGRFNVICANGSAAECPRGGAGVKPEAGSPCRRTAAGRRPRRPHRRAGRVRWRSLPARRPGRAPDGKDGASPSTRRRRQPQGCAPRG